MAAPLLGELQVLLAANRSGELCGGNTQQLHLFLLDVLLDASVFAASIQSFEGHQGSVSGAGSALNHAIPSEDWTRTPEHGVSRTPSLLKGGFG